MSLLSMMPGRTSPMHLIWQDNIGYSSRQETAGSESGAWCGKHTTGKVYRSVPTEKPGMSAGVPAARMPSNTSPMPTVRAR